MNPTKEILEPKQIPGGPHYVLLIYASSDDTTIRHYATDDLSEWQEWVSKLMRADPDRTDLAAFWTPGLAEVKVRFEIDVKAVWQ